MSTETPNTDDLQDRLIDQALREKLGGETPPDLSDKILTAASVSSQDVSTLAANTQSRSAISKHQHWVIFAAAASLLVALGWIVISTQYNGLRHAKVNISDTATNNLHSLSVPNEESQVSTELVTSLGQPVDPVGTKEVVDTLAIADLDWIGGASGEQNSEPSAVPVEISASGSTYTLADSSSEGSSSLSMVGGQEAGSSAPRQQDTEQGLAARIQTPRPQLGRAKKKDQKTSGGDVVLEGFGTDLDVPFRNESFALSVPGSKSERESLRQDKSTEVLSTISPPVIYSSNKTWGLYANQWRKWPSVDSNNVKVRPVPGLIIESGEHEERLSLYEGPDTSGDQYTRIYENPFIVAAGEDAVSTFSIDVDTASYANVRQFLMQSATLPPPDAVRIEELVNYFDYNYSGPTGEVPFAAHVEVAGCPWQAEHRLVRVGIKGREIERKSRPQSNLVFLIDVSGSMNNPDKLPLLVEGMKLLTRELGENDRVAIVVYASSEGLALPSTRGDQQDTILAALEKLRAGGSTAGGAGIQLAYQIAQDHFIKGGVNRVILATDGDFNVGTTSTAELERMAETKAKETGVFLTVLGFGRGNLNDAMMEAISGKGNGNYHYIDNQSEARKVLVEEMVGTLITIAKDVKIQIEFNPAQVAGYRLIGYENRMLRTEDFNDDKKDAGEIGAGHTVTAIYEIVPAGKAVDSGSVDPLKYQQTAKSASDGPVSDDLLTLKIRYKKPDGDTSTKLEFPISDNGNSFAEASGDFKFAAAVASFGMLLRDSEHRGNTSYAAVSEIAASVVNQPSSGPHPDPHGYREEFLQIVRQAKVLAGE